MSNFVLFAQPWWVNLVILVPFVSYYVWQKEGLQLSKKILFITAVFGISFGFLEASVVVYLRAAVGLLPGYGGTLADVARLSTDIYQQSQILGDLPESLFRVEWFREIATMGMLLSVAFLPSDQSLRERFAIFLWVFAIWDIVYYAGLWVTVGWPASLLTHDILFLIPTPWISQVWFPIAVSVLGIIAVIFARKRGENS